MREVSAEVSNLSATVEEIAASPTEIDEQSDRAVDLAEEGHAVADDARDTIEEMGDATETVTGDVAELRDRVDEIDEVVTVIDDIADRTNLLPHNASIEVARAGSADSGAEGFVVVTGEVKSLVEESSDQVGRIEATVREIEQQADETVDSLEEMRSDRLPHGPRRDPTGDTMRRKIAQ
ncbi:methyl-accepting chemotaxis protein [Halobaculum sp. MBLA0147]|uniref:methyl-accepting chemotaxis protein n=1 Tax=Halobaculum sp. MBLA0147 TaxID=3079934 RepID=UPI0035232A4B